MIFKNIYVYFVFQTIMETSSSEKPYSKESLTEAVRLILNGHLNVSEAFEKYNRSIPKRTLQNHVKYEKFQKILILITIIL